MEEEKIEGFEKWKVEGDLSSLQTAEEIRNDSKRMKAVGILAERKLQPLRRLARKAEAKRTMGF